MLGLGFPELLMVLLIILLLFGARRLPQMGKGIGEGIKNFRKSVKEIKEDDGEKGAKEA